AADGRRGFYEGEFGHALLALGAGEYTEADLTRVNAEWVRPLGLDAFGQRVWSLPPNSLGYLMLRSAAIASELALPDPEDPEWAHLLVEVSRAAAADRDDVWHERSDGPALIAPGQLDALRAEISAARAPGAAPSVVRGGTVAITVIDEQRMAVSMLQSNFLGW